MDNHILGSRIEIDTDGVNQLYAPLSKYQIQHVYNYGGKDNLLKKSLVRIER
jgi:hypothetical protein